MAYLIEIDEETYKLAEKLKDITMRSFVDSDGMPQWLADDLKRNLTNSKVIKSALRTVIAHSDPNIQITVRFEEK